MIATQSCSKLLNGGSFYLKQICVELWLAVVIQGNVKIRIIFTWNFALHGYTTQKKQSIDLFHVIFVAEDIFYISAYRSHFNISHPNNLGTESAGFR